jgi:hypothetical protein
MIRSTRILLGLCVLAGGCAAPRTVTILTKPPDAMIKIDGVDQGQAPVTRPIAFTNPNQVHLITASRRGYKESTVQLTSGDTRSEILIELKPLTRVVYFHVEPVPGIIKINGETVSDGPVVIFSRELTFTTDERNNWTSYTVTAERDKMRPASVTVSWPDNSPNYTLTLGSMSKDLSITSNPEGATVTMDGQPIGTTPLFDPARSFPVDIDTNQYQTRSVRLEKPGYDPVELDIGWDDGKTDYHVDFRLKTKQVRITTDPPSAKVTIDGVRPDREGAMTVFTLSYPPDERGDLPVYRGLARRDSPDSEWEPAAFTIPWENGREDYLITLKEILTRPVPLTIAAMRRSDLGWECVPQQIDTLAMKESSDGSTRPPAIVLSRLQKGQSIGSMAMAPDGERILFTILNGTDRDSFRSQMAMVRTDASGSVEYITDGKTLDITPTFSPGGDEILFASNRAGRRLQIWSMPATGRPGITRLITSETHDLWPSLDSDPKPRLYYQAMVDTRSEPRIFVTPLGTVSQTDLTVAGGTQPRVSPKNDSIVYCSVNDRTGKRDLYLVSERGGAPQNLTNSPDADECDPVWSRDGRRIAFASDRATDPDGRRQYDIWVLDVVEPGKPLQITINGSVDDNPLFSPDGSAIYFRSNRSGVWGIWKVSLR